MLLEDWFAWGGAPWFCNCARFAIPSPFLTLQYILFFLQAADAISMSCRQHSVQLWKGYEDQVGRAWSRDREWMGARSPCMVLPLRGRVGGDGESMFSL